MRGRSRPAPRSLSVRWARSDDELAGSIEDTGSGLAPAAAVVEAASPPRLVRVGFSAVATPFLVVLGPLALLLALALA